jgi:hypothetical protein
MWFVLRWRCRAAPSREKAVNDLLGEAIMQIVYLSRFGLKSINQLVV